ncbi:DUF2817 domain-containing protein [Mesorhizobium sp. M0146]|uniref:DUF2817 domain-containing protein n=1 Tax=unclassified Mesorhizobium TaxID=325217 RepID=UPI003336900E
MNLRDHTVNLNGAKHIAHRIFSDTYLEARRKFASAAPMAKAYPCSAKGPSGEALFTDVAYLGDRDAKRLLVLISATHGPEGYCGSAGQLLFLESELAATLPPSTGVLLVHALNCYGFAWDRRVTAEGCDLNRNFVDFSQPLPANPEYDELAEYFVPNDISKEGVQRADALVAAYVAAHGGRALRQARTGQYTTRTGAYYGGSKPTEARITLERIADDFGLAARDQVIILDYHTGLGPYGYGELMCEEISGLDGYDRAVKIFGPSATSPVLGTSAAIPIHGAQAEFWERALGDRHTYICLEFGTYPGGDDHLMRDDHWLFLHRPEAVNAELGQRIRKATKDYFYPQRADWMEMIAWRSHMVHRQAIEALAG